eukprot:2786883-Prymnesium_polylepis.1
MRSCHTHAPQCHTHANTTGTKPLRRGHHAAKLPHMELERGTAELLSLWGAQHARPPRVLRELPRSICAQYCMHRPCAPLRCADPVRFVTPLSVLAHASSPRGAGRGCTAGARLAASSTSLGTGGRSRDA